MRHFFVLTGVGLALVTLMFLFPALRAGAEAVGALLGPSSDAEGDAFDVGALPLGAEDRRALPGARSFSARSSLGFPLQVVELRSGDEPWVEHRLDEYGRWNQHEDPRLEVRAPGHWPGRTNPGSRQFVLEPQFELVVRTDPGVADQVIARPIEKDGEAPRSSLVLHGPALGATAYGFAATTDYRRGDGPVPFEYDLETPYPVRLRLSFAVERAERHEIDLEDLIQAQELRTLSLLARCAHPDTPVRFALAAANPVAAERRPMPWGEAVVQRGVWRGELEGRVDRALDAHAIKDEVHVGAICERGCFGSSPASAASTGSVSVIEVALREGYRVRGWIGPVFEEELGPPRTVHVHCGFTSDPRSPDPKWSEGWSWTQVIDVTDDGTYELLLPGRAPSLRSAGHSLPSRVRLRFSATGFQDEVLWLTLDEEREHDGGRIGLMAREPQFILAAGHGLDPAALDLETLRSIDLEATILGAAETPDGELRLYCLPTRSFVSPRTRERYDDVEAFLVRLGGAPMAFERGARGTFVRTPTQARTLNLACLAFPSLHENRVFLGWTWRGLSAVTHAIDRRRIGTEWTLEMQIPSGAEEVWWSGQLGPAPADRFGGSVPFTRALDRVTIR